MNQVYQNSEEAATSGTRNEREERRALREQLLGDDASRALAFQTVAVKHFGADGGIFIRQLLYRDGSGKDEEFWIYKSMEEWREETGLSRRAQERARKRLIGADVMEEKKALIHGRRTLHFRVKSENLMERVGDDLPHAKPSTSGTDCTVKRTGSMSVNRTGSMSAPDRDHADSRQGITEDYSEDHSEEVTPLSPPSRGADCEEFPEPTRGEEPGIPSTSLSGGQPTQPEKQASSTGEAKHSRRKRSRSTSEAGIEAIATYDNVTYDSEGVGWGGVNDSAGNAIKSCRGKLVEIAERWDFASSEDPPMKIRLAVSPNRDECDRMIKRLSRIVAKAEGVPVDQVDEKAGKPRKTFTTLN